MKGMALFAGMSDVRDSLIEESLMLFDTPAAELCPKGQSAFSRFLNSGWGVAVICTVVSLSVLMGIIRAGQNPPGGVPGVSDGTAGYEESSPEVTDSPETTAAETTAAETEAIRVEPPDNSFGGVIVDPHPTVPTPNIPSTPNPSPNLPGFNWDYDLPNTPPGPTYNPDPGYVRNPNLGG